ncbi:MAG TPA: hypothetical protein VFL13_13510 [Candidatus Baltobacteraceae bacterium]|nr:hypothetical protein [Candidatus Baltobacteraceae bacterium]
MQRSKTMLNQAVGRGTGLLADRIEHYTNIAREVGDILRDRGEPQAADVAVLVSERVQGVARYLRNSDGTQLVSDLQDALRGRTWLLTGVGFVSGLAIARAVRTSVDYSTSQRTYTEDYSQQTGQYRNSPYAEQYSQ